MTTPPISGDPLSFSYHEKMSWEVTEENIDETFQLKSFIPGTFRNDFEREGGYIKIDYFERDQIRFVTHWPKEVDLDQIHVDADFKVKTDEWEIEVVIEGGQSETVRSESNDLYNELQFIKRVCINEGLVEDGSKLFILEADLVVNMKYAGISSSSQQTEIFQEEMKSILNDEETSDILVIAEDEVFKCHKNILRARSEVFKNMLGHDTLESKMNKIVIKEIAAKPVEDMLKYLYSGEIPIDPEILTTELLQLADMHQLHPLKEACLKNLIARLEASSCISTLILVDRYQPLNMSLRDKVIEFIKCQASEGVVENDCDKLVDTHPALAKELLRVFVRGNKEKGHMCSFCMVSYT